MTIQEIPTAIALSNSIAKAEMCQDIFRYIMQNKYMTRIEILEYILNESQQTTTLAQSLLQLLNQQEAALERKREAIAKEFIHADDASQTSDPERVIDAEYVDREPPDLTHNKDSDKL